MQIFYSTFILFKSVFKDLGKKKLTFSDTEKKNKEELTKIEAEIKTKETELAAIRTKFKACQKKCSDVDNRYAHLRFQ